MKIEGTELEYSKNDLIGLEYYLEEFKEWGKRVWDNCQQYQANNGLFPNGRKMPTIYAKSPHDIWKNKIIRRRMALARDLLGKPVVKLEGLMTECPEEYNDDCMIQCLANKDYITRKEKIKKEELELQEIQEKIKLQKKKEVKELIESGISPKAIKLLRKDLISEL